MGDRLKSMTDYLVGLGIDRISHTGKTYLTHLIAVYRGLRSWGCDEEVCLAGMFHSIYGTEMFQGFKLPFDRRGEVCEKIGERAERLAYWNCAMDRESFDQAVLNSSGPYRFQSRVNDETFEVGNNDFDDLCRVHLNDWLEQVPRSKKWTYRREAYRQLSVRLGPATEEAFLQVYAQAPTGPEIAR